MDISYLKSWFSYNPETGDVTWIKSPCNSVKVGNVAGRDNGFGYLKLQLKGKKYYVHRVAYALYHGKEPDKIDHINGNSKDNRIENLRSCTQKSNARNQKIRSTNTSGVNGVSFCKKRKRYEATICVNGKTIHLGRFLNLDEAAKARASADERYNFHRNHGKR